MKQVFHFRVEEIDHRQRFDEFLFKRIGTVSKMHLRNLLKAGEGKVNGAAREPGFRVKTGDKIEISVDLSAETSMKPHPIRLEIFYEDTEILVVDKPPEMLVHPTRGVKSGTLLNALSHHFNRELFQALNDKSLTLENRNQAVGQRENITGPGEFIRPGLIHRLDKETSGLMVIAKTGRAHKILSDHFQRKLVEKKYFALVEGVVRTDAGVITASIGYYETLKKWGVQEDGKAAETRFKVLERRKSSTLLELEPVTGRTNQLRIHCEHLGHPIVGDRARGGREFSRLGLHAYKLSFWHPNGSERLEFATSLPDDFALVDAQSSTS